MSEAALKEAIRRAGGPKALASKLGISHQAIAQWKACPPLRVVDVERVTGISRDELRPDIFSAPVARTAS